MIQGFMGKKTVAGVMSAFNKAIDDLRQVEVEQEQEVARQAQIAAEAEAARQAALAEMNLSREVQNKLLSIVQPTIVQPTIDMRGAY